MTQDQSENTKILLRDYDSRGWQFALIPANSKAPVASGWPQGQHDAAAIAAHVARGGNIGLRLGPLSGDLADLDLDCAEALALADLYLPETSAVFGRASKPASHRLYIAPGAIFANFADPLRDKKNTLLEMRAPGRDGGAHLTLIPPSIADGERRFWQDDRIEPAILDAGILTRRASWLAIGCLTMRYVSEHAAQRPEWDLLDILWEFDQELGRRAYHWAGKPAPDERRPKVKPRHDYTHSELRLEEVCAAIRNDCDWHDWNRVGMAIYNASGGCELGFIAFDDFSARSPKYNPRAVRERWKNYRRSPPNRIGLGTLVHLARQAGWMRSAA